jgi:phage terminase large subunit-like protein
VAIVTSTRSCPAILNEAAVAATSNSHYAGWENDGRLITTPGNMTDYAWIADDIVEDASQFRIVEVPHDPYHAAALVTFIQARGDWPQAIPFVEFRQTVQMMSPAAYELEGVIMDGRLHHDGNPILAWMISNVIFYRDKKNNIFPHKEREENKIDGAVALMMALSRATAQDGSDQTSQVFFV